MGYRKANQISCQVCRRCLVSAVKHKNGQAKFNAFGTRMHAASGGRAILEKKDRIYHYCRPILISLLTFGIYL